LAEKNDIRNWLPTSRKDIEILGWDEIDVIIFSGDAYVDHPSFGPAVIGRVIGDEGFRVAIVPNLTGRMTYGILRSWGNQNIFSELQQVIWIQW